MSQGIVHAIAVLTLFAGVSQYSRIILVIISLPLLHCSDNNFLRGVQNNRPGLHEVEYGVFTRDVLAHVLEVHAGYLPDVQYVWRIRVKQVPPLHSRNHEHRGDIRSERIRSAYRDNPFY